MENTRKRHSADFKAKVALEALKGDLSLAQLAAKHRVHQTMISTWRKKAVDGMASVFSGNAGAGVCQDSCRVKLLSCSLFFGLGHGFD